MAKLPGNRLSTDRLTLAYDQNEIIRDLGISIPDGKVTALVGPNGCGKSTLLHGLARLMAPKSGAVLLDGKAIAKRSSKDVARQLGILPQGPVAPEGMTVRELVAQGRYPHQSLLRQWSASDEEAVAWALDITSLEELVDRRLDTLSGGQRQRAWIAMTLAQETPVLLLDEPTTFLDLAHQVEILSLLDELNEREGRTIVMVLHDINQACRYAHHLVALKGGQVVAQGDPLEVVNRGMVCDVFGIECFVVHDPVSGTPLCLPQSCPLRLLPKQPLD
ncbi:MAG: ABC transporter ATP-binding protein [Trueperaceae bacterium]